jgi:hypothetical protein
MNIIRGLLTGLLLLATTATGYALQLMDDPYEILSAHYEAIGGMDRLRAEKASFFEASISLFGLEGTIKQWEAPPIRQRQEVDLGILTHITGDNGEYAWTVDSNGKLQIKRDEQTMKRREVEKRIALFEHIDRDSRYFGLTLRGIEDVDGVSCYVVRIDNSINQDVRVYYIGTDDLYMHKSVLKEVDHEAHTRFSDYRDVGGLLIAFQQEIELLPIGQKHTVSILKYVSNPEIDPAIFEPPGSGPKDYRFTNGASAEDIPFRYIADHLFIDVSIGCDRRTWIVDTGASVTVVDADYAEELGLEVSGRMKGYGAGTTVEASFAELPPFSVYGIEFDSQRVAVLAISGLLRRAGIDVVGILGYDFLSRFVVKVDYAAERLSFYDPVDFEYYGGGKVIDRPLKERFFVVPMVVGGEYSGDWTLDIGAGGTSFFFPFAQAHGFLEREGVETLSGGAGGYHATKIVKFDSLEIAGFTLEDPLISIPAQGGGALGSREGTGNLGNDVLRHFVVYLDYERQQVILEKGGNFGKKFPVDKSGLSLVVNGGEEIEVFFVSPETPAARAGFRRGDIVKSVNGIPVELLDGAIALRELLKAEAGTEYKFLVHRDGETRKINLKLRNLF